MRRNCIERIILEIYIDDIVVKTDGMESHIADLRLAFERMRRYGLKMNPLKCAFGVSAGKFLGFMVHERGVEIDPKKTEKIRDFKAPTCKKEVQKLLAPKVGMPFWLYIAAEDKVIGAVLTQEKDGKEYIITYLSRRLLDAETSGVCFEASVRLEYYCTNNQVEYNALLFGLQVMEMIGVTHVEAFGNSELVVQQVAGVYKCLDGSLNWYLDQCLDIIANFDDFAIRHISRHDNSRGNDLAQQASSYNVKRGLFLILEKPVLDFKSLDEIGKVTDQGRSDRHCTTGLTGDHGRSDWPDAADVCAQETEEYWRIPLIRYLKDPSLKVDRKIQRQVFKYTWLDGDLYRRNIDAVLLKCLDDDQSKVAMGEVNEGICGTHQSAHKMNWFLRACEAYQRFGNVQLAPAAMLNPIIKPWPFRGWALDFIGQIYPSSPKGHRFGIPQTLTTDQGASFMSKEVKSFAKSYDCFLLPLSTQANGEFIILLTTEFGNISVGGEDGIKAESEIRIVAATETLSKCGNHLEAYRLNPMLYTKSYCRVGSPRPRVFCQHAFGTPDPQGDNCSEVQKKIVAYDLGTSSSKDRDRKQALDGSAQSSIKGATDGSLGNQGNNSQGVHGGQASSLRYTHNLADGTGINSPTCYISYSARPANEPSAINERASTAYGQVANRPTQGQVAAMFLPPQHAVDLIQQQPIQQQSIQQTPQIQQVVQPIQQQIMQPAQPIQQLVIQPVQQTPPRQQSLQPIQQTTLKQQIVQPIQHQAQYRPGGLAQPQFASQYGQFEPMQRQSQGATQQRPWADVIADVMREQFGLKPKETRNLYRQPYPEWFERVPPPNRFKVLDFFKFSGQDGVSTYEHISQFLAQCGEASAVDALKVRLFQLSLSESAFTWFSSLPYGLINSWADLEKQFHSYFYSGVHEMKLSDLTAIKQRHDKPVHEYIQRFREIRNKCFSLSLTDAQLADLAFQGMIAPIREKFSSEDFDSIIADDGGRWPTSVGDQSWGILDIPAAVALVRGRRFCCLQIRRKVS
uniref:Reverse transcriptase domain-containing protein n=1 Tax=Oryza sativa subsp. japonica TaxID=39947 RepID=Q75HS0_ORYSJ|nr:hypothetical protein [Oryza sativa Japonica Group]